MNIGKIRLEFASILVTTLLGIVSFGCTSERLASNEQTSKVDPQANESGSLEDDCPGVGDYDCICNHPTQTDDSFCRCYLDAVANMGDCFDHGFRELETAGQFKEKQVEMALAADQKILSLTPGDEVVLVAIYVIGNNSEPTLEIAAGRYEFTTEVGYSFARTGMYDRVSGRMNPVASTRQLPYGRGDVIAVADNLEEALAIAAEHPEYSLNNLDRI